MSSVSLPCPVCAVPLILDEKLVGKEVACPGCHSRLKMPDAISPESALTFLTAPPAQDRHANTGELPKSALPQARAKTADEELKRLAGAAAAAGAVNSFKADQASSLPADHQRTQLPTKRSLPPAAVPEDLPAAGKTGIVLPFRRKSAPTGEAITPSPIQPIQPIQPIEPRPDVEISATRLSGPSRFVRPAMPEEETPAKAEPSSFDPDLDALEVPGTAPGPEVKGGFRLGGKRSLHFSPVHALENAEEAATWGATPETPDQAARSRQFITVSFIIALLAIGGAVLYTLRQAFQAPEAIAALTSDPAAPGQPMPENVMANVEDARRVMDRFLAADSVEKMVAEVRHPEETRPRMERFYATIPVKRRLKRAESQSWNEIRIGEKEFIRAVVELDDFRVYPFTLELIPGADPKVDWESFVNWSELPWKDFLKTPPEQAVDYRVTLTTDPADQYYNYYSKDRELDLMCFKIEDPEKYGSCWAYCDKDSEAASQILFNLKRARQQGSLSSEGKIAITCILRLRFPPEGMKTNQVVIEKLVNDNWVLP